jgi:uncharacterized protein
VEAAIMSTPHILLWMVSAETQMMVWRQYLDFSVQHTKSLGTGLRIALGVPFYGLDAESVGECLKQLPKYLKNKNAVGMGEIGMDTSIPDEEKLFRAQLNIAREHNFTVIVHTPTPLEPQASAVLKKIIRVIKEE